MTGWVLRPLWLSWYSGEEVSRRFKELESMEVCMNTSRTAGSGMQLYFLQHMVKEFFQLPLIMNTNAESVNTGIESNLTELATGDSSTLFHMSEEEVGI